jgi:hypothetical protein
MAGGEGHGGILDVWVATGGDRESTVRDADGGTLERSG